ncbi:MAG: hypothetical protein D6719_09850 [Candidatus Dadabacteria bacterium]|nr:MAG: hypothetical protein D6719_09850 [Candidatus Dadabacteria bacterium]
MSLIIKSENSLGAVIFLSGLVTAVFAFSSLQSSTSNDMLFPAVLALLLTLVSLQVVIKKNSESYDKTSRNSLRVLLIACVSAFYIYLAEAMGYYPATAVSLPLLAVILGYKKIFPVVFVTVLWLASAYLLFEKLLQISLG